MSHTMNSSPLEIDILDETEFFDSLNEDISEADNHSRVALTTMSFNPGEPRVNQIIHNLHAAAMRSAEIKLGIDAYTFLVDSITSRIGPSLLPLPFGQKIFKQRREALEELDLHPSVQLSILNEPSRKLSNPYSGRSHIKTMVVDDRVYVAGINMHDVSRKDMAISFTNAPVADQLYNTVSNLVDKGSTKDVFENEDQVWQLDDKTELVIDAGVSGKSSILDRAYGIVDDSTEELIITSQFLPRYKMLSKLGLASLRGVNTRAFHNNPHVQDNIFYRLPEMFAVTYNRQLLNLEDFVFQLPRNIRTHSKALASERSAIVGSHNFDERGVNFGTAEMSVISSDPVFAARLGDFLLGQVGWSKISGTPAELSQEAA